MNNHNLVIGNTQNGRKSNSGRRVKGIGKAGAVLNMVGSVFYMVLFAFMMLFIIGIPLFVLAYFTWRQNKKFLNGEETQRSAGVLGLFTGFSIIGCVLVLCHEE